MSTRLGTSRAEWRREILVSDCRKMEYEVVELVVIDEGRCPRPSRSSPGRGEL